MTHRRGCPGFTLIELLISISVISIILSLVMPVLGRARSGARTVKCTGQLRQLGLSWQLYADDYRGHCMPQVWFKAKPPVYWWGANGDPADYEAGLVYPYLEMKAGLDNVFDCPEQPWGSYIPQGAARAPTTTYGYNGLYLAPPASGWGVVAARSHWRTIEDIELPSQLFILADTMLDWTNKGHVSNNCFLDGPQVPWGTGWAKNAHPTLRFRHRSRAVVFFGDSHVDSVPGSAGHITSKASKTGYVGDDNYPHYVPNWRQWFPCEDGD